MRQIGTIVETEGKVAKIECDKKSACDMCENAAGCTEKCKKVYATAINEINAQIGDRVEIETDTKNLLLNAFVVFVLPIIAAVISFFVCDGFLDEGIAVVITLAVLVGCSIGLSFVMNKRAKLKNESKVIRILE